MAIGTFTFNCSAAQAGLMRPHGMSPGVQDEDAEEAADAAPPAEEAAADDALEPPAGGNDELAGRLCIEYMHTGT